MCDDSINERKLSCLQRLKMAAAGAWDFSRMTARLFFSLPVKREA
jgi:hypothetical protein